MAKITHTHMHMHVSTCVCTAHTHTLKGKKNAKDAWWYTENIIQDDYKLRQNADG